MIENLVAVVGEQARTPTDYVEQDWTNEQWTRGCPSATSRPACCARNGAHLRSPHGAIHFAGTETADYWLGYMDGGVRAGERAAREVLRDLSLGPDRPLVERHRQRRADGHDRRRPEQRVRERVREREDASCGIRRRGCRTGGAASSPATTSGSTRRTSAATPGSVLVGTNVLAMNVIGKITMNAMPCTASGVLTRLAIITPIQITANENAIIRP